MNNKKGLILLGVMILLFLNFVNAELISPDPCSNPTMITQDSNYIYYNSGCFKIRFDKIYNEESPILFYDSYNNDYFELKLHSLTEQNSVLTNQQRVYSFEDIGLTISIDGDKVVYTSADGKIRLLYSVTGNKVKAGFELIGWTNYYTTSNFYLKTKIHKEDTANSHFTNLPAVVDDVKQPLKYNSEISGNNEFIVQTLYTGSSFSFLEIDPLYTVDYSPIPAVHLIGGLLPTYPESLFASENDITSVMTDNNSVTSREIVNYAIYKPLSQIFYTGWESGTTTGWTTSCTGSCGGTEIAVTTPAINGSYSLRLNGDGDFGDVETAIVSRVLSTVGYSNISLSYRRYTTGKETGDYLYFEVSSNGGSTWTTIETINGNSVLTTKTFNLSPSYSNNINFTFRIRSAVNYLDDISYVDDIYLKGFDTASTNKAISGRWSQVYDSNYDYFLRVNKVTSGTNTIYIYGYNNSDAISNQYVSKSIIGTGYFNINVSSLINYMTNTKGLSFSQLRFWTTMNQNISEFWLRKEVNDTEVPTISNCSIDDVAVSCLGSTNMTCLVTDNIEVDEVKFLLNSINYTALNDIDHYDITFYPTGNTTSFYDWQNVYAKDILGNKATYDPNLSFNYSCNYEDYINITHNPSTDIFVTNVSAIINWTTSHSSDSMIYFGDSPSNLSMSGYSGALVLYHSLEIDSMNPSTTYYYGIISANGLVNASVGIYNFSTTSGCVENWIAYYDSCLINDTKLKYYLDDSLCGTLDYLPIDNRTYVGCDYCSEDIEQVLGLCDYINGSYIQTVDYTDNDYFSCCAITGIISDCSIDYSPYNESTIQVCNTSLEHDFEISIDTALYFGFGIGGLHSDKVNGKIWINDTNTTYYCVSYVETPDRNLLQTNPSYTKRTDNTLSIIPKEIEDREFFVTENGLSNVYWTDYNLIIDGRQYIFGVECAGDGNNLKSEVLSQVFYDSVNAPITRWFWFKENVTAIILFLLLFFIIVIIAGVYIRELRRR